MSYTDGWAAINFQMPKRIPRIEFDAERHWELVKRVTGIDVGVNSPTELQQQATAAFMRAWNYDLRLSATVFHDDLGTRRTSMGHAVYAAGGVDYDDNVYCSFNTVEEVLAYDPWEAIGPRDKHELIRRFDDSYRANCAAFPDAVNTTGVYITLVSGMIGLFGWEMLLVAAGTDPAGFGRVMNRYASWMQQYYDALAESAVPVIYSHDDIVWTRGAVFRPGWYRAFVFPNLRKYYRPLIDAGKKIIFISDGNYTEFVDDIAACGVHGFFFEPLTDLNYIAERYGRTHVMIGNVDTRVLLSGTKQQIRAEVERCIAIGRNCPGYFIGVTNMIPSNTPVDSAMYYNEVYEELCMR